MTGTSLTLADRRVLLGSMFGEGLELADLTWLMDGGRRLLVRDGGEIVAFSGQPQDAFFFVLSGRLEVARTRSDGSRHVIDRVRQGDVCGAVTAFSERSRWPANVHAASDVRLLVVRTRDLWDHPEPNRAQLRMLHNCTRILAERALHMNARAELLARRGLRERLAFYLLMNSDELGVVQLDLTRQTMAEMVGVSRASMTRELGRMADEGLISIKGRSFIVHDKRALREIAS